MGQFMYFPENKLEYLPAIFQVVVVILIAVLVFRLIRKMSMREAAKAKKLEQEILTRAQNNGESKPKED